MLVDMDYYKSPHSNHTNKQLVSLPIYHYTIVAYANMVSVTPSNALKYGVWQSI